MIISSNVNAGTLTVSLTGRLDSVTSSTAQSDLERLLGTHNGPVTLDCSKLEYLSSAGLRVLLFLAKKKKSSLTLSGMSKPIREIIDISGFLCIFKTQ